MNSNNDNNNNDKQRRREEMMKKLEQTRNEQMIVQSIMRRMAETISSSSTFSKKRENTQAYAKERAIINSVNNTGLGQGIAAGLVTFFVLRGGPRFLYNTFTRIRGGGRSYQQQSSYQLDRHPTQEQKGGAGVAILTALKFGLDIFTSLLVASTISFSATNFQTVAATAAGIPLVEGRSMVSEEVCPLLREELNKLKKDDNTSNILTNIQSTSLQALVVFGENCGRRQAYEAQLRQQQGRSRDEPVDIPPPGVPINVVVEEMYDSNDYDDDDSDGGGNMDGMDFYDPPIMTPEQQWADSMVTDYQDDDADDSKNKQERRR